jgi:hypothetical protein
VGSSGPTVQAITNSRWDYVNYGTAGGMFPSILRSSTTARPGARRRSRTPTSPARTTCSLTRSMPSGSGTGRRTRSTCTTCPCVQSRAR